MLFWWIELYISHFRSIVYDITVITKYKITTLLLFLRLLSRTQGNHQYCPHTFSIFMLNDQLQLCIRPFGDDVKRQWQQCWYCLQIQIIFTEHVLSRATTSNHTEWDLESKKAVPTFPSPSVAPGFAHHNGDEVFPCPGTQQHHAQAVLVVCSQELASTYPARMHSSSGHWPLYQMACDGQASLFLLKNMTCMTSEPPDCTVQYTSMITLRYAIQHSVVSAEINASMTCQPLKWDWGMNFLHFSNAAGWWQEEHA